MRYINTSFPPGAWEHTSCCSAAFAMKRIRYLAAVGTQFQCFASKRARSWLARLSLIDSFLVFASASAHADDRPNILWISCEDISPNLGCYGDTHAITPNLDALARSGVRFDRAFTPAGVCAVVRSGVITGMYPPSIGSQHMRSRIIPPADVKAFPELLRAAGYFTTNRSKTDYQFEPTPSIWDRQGNNHKDWRERDDPGPAILLRREHYRLPRKPNPTQRRSSPRRHQENR